MNSSARFRDVATCPYCGRFLDTNHRCVGLSRRLARRAARSAVAMLAGALVVTLFVFVIDGNPTDLVIAIGMLLGAILGQALLKALSQ